jgi:16S rRNA G966 N2-methylase RsmD
MDFTKYEFTLDCDHPNWITDKRHVEIIFEFLMQTDLQRVAELGCYTGFSTAAFIEALNKGKDFRLHLVDTCPTVQLKKLISMCDKPDNVVFHEQAGRDVLQKWGDFDLVFVDANHSIEGAGGELLMMLRNNTQNIMAHDTNLINLIEKWGGEGSELIARVLSSHKDYFCLEDKKERVGEKTDRGFFFASRQQDKYKIAKDIFEKLC